MNEHIIITKAQAENIRGKYGKYSAIEPLPTPDGNYIIPEHCLNDVDLVEIKSAIQSAITDSNIQQILKLPLQGENCDIGYYLYDNEVSPLVYCRQNHIRTEHAIKDIPNLFTFFRKEVSGQILAWIPNELVKPHWVRSYGGNNYTFIGAAETLTVEGQTPDISASIWKVYVDPNVIPVWKQPTGAHDAYQKGDRVHFPAADSSVYESLIDANTWSPIDYPAGWLLIT